MDAACRRAAASVTNRNGERIGARRGVGRKPPHLRARAVHAAAASSPGVGQGIAVRIARIYADDDNVSRSIQHGGFVFRTRGLRIPVGGGDSGRMISTEAKNDSRREAHVCLPTQSWASRRVESPE